MTYWTKKEHIQEEKNRLNDFIKAGLEEIDYNLKIKLRSIKHNKNKEYW